MITNYIPDVNKMYTYLRGNLTGAKMTESLKALQYARDMHKEQTRKNGVPYIVHPLSMACYAIAINIHDDNTIATILLHDIVEDCGVNVDLLPFNDVIKRGVKYMTIVKFDTDRDKLETKSRYFNNLLESKEAVIAKAVDRYNNLSDMPFALSDDAIGKNIAETEVLLLPVLKEAKERYIELSDVLFALRTNIRITNDILKKYNQESYDKWYKFYTGESK
ncbi:MAG: bifunctional (p)ppGpp synthetase/guanosine-3',5'-bis(diphosphate) 3'-pyrophosphohydrolase [Lachnospiraceae bacterium]|nr:bifunctional (p)ppGpp synthetase/guanosine-3',5'-bis(diphosphate) 3'-pyrophosphohydrolase [Lachnospiraceae bacterium]